MLNLLALVHDVVYLRLCWATVLARTPAGYVGKAEEEEEVMVDVVEAMAGTKRKRGWDVSESSDDKENQDVSAKNDTVEWSEEALEAAPKTLSMGCHASRHRRCCRCRGDAVTLKAGSLSRPRGPATDGANHHEPARLTVEGKHNRYMTDKELDSLLPSEGYMIVPPPAGHAPLRARIQSFNAAAPEPTGFHIKDGSDATAAAAAEGLAQGLPTEIPGVDSLAFFKAEDTAYFSKILKEEDETQLTVDEMKERKIMRLLLKIKNGTPPVRKMALRQITDSGIWSRSAVRQDLPFAHGAYARGPGAASPCQGHRQGLVRA